MVYFSEAKNDVGHKQFCVYAECLYSGDRIGPIWSHSRAAVRRALATLTEQCGCGRKFHKHRRTEGWRVVDKA